MSNGWIKLHRSIADHPRFKDQKWLIVWIRCLTLATHKPYSAVFGGKVIELQKGQFITSRKSLSEKTGVSESTVERILKTLENEQQIGQQSSSVSRLITVTNWAEYQEDEQPFEQQMDSGRTAGGQRADTNKKIKNEEEEKNTHLPPSRGKRKPKTVIDANWTPSPETLEWCAEKKLPEPDFQIIPFVTYWQGRGDTRADWQATFRNWMVSPYRKDRQNGINGKHPQQFESSQQRKDRRIREEVARWKSKVGNASVPDFQDVHVMPQGTTGNGHLGLRGPDSHDRPG